MVLRASRRLGRVTAVGLMVTLLSLTMMAPPGGAGHQDSFPVPREGMEILLEDYQNITITFGGPTEVLAGHHEWREAATATHVVDHGGNHTWEVATFYDLTTGYAMFSGETGTQRNPWLNLGTPLDGAFVYEHDHAWAYQEHLGVDHMLPESILWGRAFWGWDHLELPYEARSCVDGHTTYDAISDGSQDGTTNITVTLITRCTWDYAENLTSEVRWDLHFPNGPALLASERILTLSHSNGDETWSHAKEIPASVVSNGTKDLLFEGRPEAAFWAPRDLTLQFSPQDGLFPADPDPHPVFDLREAGTIAVQTDLEPVRIFFAKAEDPQLRYARMSPTDSPIVRWSFSFEDQDGQHLSVDLSGIKLPDAPLILMEKNAYRTEGWGYGRPVLQREVAAPSDLARIAEQVLDAKGYEPRGYSWQDSGQWGHVSLQSHFEIPHFTPLDGGHGSFETDGTTGRVVAYHGADMYLETGTADLF